MDIAAAVEGVASRLGTEVASELRGRVCGVLRKARPPPSNLHKERTALRTLKQDKSIVVLPADKGNATVIIMDTDKDEEKITDLLKDPVYRKVRRDPTAATERVVLKEVRELEKKIGFPEPSVLSLNHQLAGHPSYNYGLPKIHKPLRPIVSYISSPAYQLTKHLTILIVKR